MTDINELAAILEKSKKWDARKDAIEEYAKKIDQAMTILKEVMLELRPQMIEKRERKQHKYEEELNMIYEKMSSGLNVSTDMIMNILQCDESEARYIGQKIRKMKNVQVRKEGITAFYYI